MAGGREEEGGGGEVGQASCGGFWRVGRRKVDSE